LALNTVTCSKKTIHCKFNRTEKSKLPIQCPKPSFSTCLSQVWHFFFPNCLLKKDEIRYQRKTFISDLRIISLLMSIIDMLTHFNMDFLRFSAILWILFLFLCFSCKKKSNTFTCLRYTNLLHNTTIKDRHTWKSFSGERWTLLKTYSWFLNAIIMEIRVWSRCVEWEVTNYITSKYQCICILNIWEF
jgi:hypothetical protein